ncbi:MAG: 3-deoxy-7-phosphoheptulonate synthase [Lachnospiraceae bacterium]|nr:3-deoxy-7-phosphoheptulonate synthase [Lachnospiraceae bacterium]
MVIILKQHPDETQLGSLMDWLKKQNIQVTPTVGAHQTILGLVGDTSSIDMDLISALDIVEDVKRVTEPYKKANRKFHPDDTVIEVGGTRIGGGSLTLIAGPCSVESEEQIVGIAKAVKASGATVLRGGAFKPRTSPYSFQGMKLEGIRLLLAAREATGLPICTEIMDASQLPLFEDIDILQVGARNMQNFTLLKELGKTKKPVLLKRGMACTYQDLLMSAEYVLAGGNPNVILCERGIRTFETYTRNTLDLACIPSLRQLTHLPIIIDPSHATGKSALVPSMCKAAVAAGADGLIVEVHNDPPHAKCDGAQSITPAAFDKLSGQLRAIKEVCGEDHRDVII